MNKIQILVQSGLKQKMINCSDSELHKASFWTCVSNTSGKCTGMMRSAEWNNCCKIYIASLTQFLMFIMMYPLCTHDSSCWTDPRNSYGGLYILSRVWDELHSSWQISRIEVTAIPVIYVTWKSVQCQEKSWRKGTDNLSLGMRERKEHINESKPAKPAVLTMAALPL